MGMLRIISICLLIHLATAPPPRRSEPTDKKHDGAEDKEEIDDFGLEYNRYLKEVIELLESDPEFKKKLEDAQEVDIRSGQIAKELDFVDHKVRTKLDEVKRQEIERLRHLAQKQYELSNGIETEHVKVSSEHLDHENPHTFEMEDLKKLIAKVSADLSAADEKRRQEFKEYEMQKEYEKQQKLQHLEGSEKEAFEKELKENETKHKQHEPLHHPGSKQQLEEVWEKQDHMENQEFDPKVFFQLHDLDGNGFWDHNEVKTLFLKELDKMYEAGAPEDDMKERMEEMERMREHVFSEADKNKDGLISYEEFIDKTKQPDFEKDYGWESLDQKPVFTQEEYHEFERRRQEEVQRMIQQGLIPPQPVFHPGQGYHPQMQYSQYHPPQYQAYPGHGQPQYRYAQDYPNAPPNQPHHGQQMVSHLHQPNQVYHSPQGVHQQPSQVQAHPQQGYQQAQGPDQQQPMYHPSQPHQNQQQGHHPSQPQGYQQHQGHPSQQQGYQQPQGHPSQQQGYQQPQGHPSQQQGYQQPQGHPSQQQGYQQPQGHPSQQQGYQQPQGHPSQQQAYQQPQGHPSQQQGYQELQGHPSQQQGHQQPQGHPSQQQGHQQPQGHPSQQQGYQHPPGSPQGYHQQNQVPLTNANRQPQGSASAQSHQNQPSQNYQPGHDPNEIQPINSQQSDLKYSKDSGNSHPNVIDLQQKKVEAIEHPSKLSNQ